MFSTPFNSFTLPLRDELLDNQIYQGVRWLLGLNINDQRIPNDQIIAQYGNSAWEVSLSLMIFIRYSKLITAQTNVDEKHLGTVDRIHEMIPLLIDHLLNCFTEEDQECISWESVTWDTAVVIRALNYVVIEYPSFIDEERRKAISEKTNCGLKWLCKQFYSWDEQIKYPFGFADVAQILHTLVFLYHNKLISPLEEIEEKTPLSHIKSLCSFLLSAQRDELNIVSTVEGDEKIRSGWWDDPFTTSEVLESISFCCRLFSSNDLEDAYREEIETIKAAVNSACTYLEKSQVDGMWGSHIDTIKIVGVYVKIGSLISSDENEYLEPEIHTTFKALRWIIDEKQILKDGSFLHTLFLTVFYVQTLIEIYDNWLPASKPIGELYDDVVWSSPTRSTPERSKRLDLELEIEKLAKDSKKLNNHNAERIWRLQQIRNTLVLFLFGIPAILLTSFLTGYLEFSISLNTNDPYSLNTSVFTGLTIFTALLTFIWRKGWKKIT